MPADHGSSPSHSAAIGTEQNSSGLEDSRSDEDGRRTGALGQDRKKPLSDLLGEIGNDPTRNVVAVGDLIRLLGDRGSAALILLFALPNVLPAPPGVSGLLGLPLLYLSSQMMLGRLPWLPRFIGNRGVPRERFAQFVQHFSPVLARAERLLRPRFSVFVSYGMRCGLGALCLVLAVVLTLPIPFGNMLPAFAICLIALGLLERDGLWVMVGAVTGVVALLIVAGVVYTLTRSALFLLLNAFG